MLFPGYVHPKKDGEKFHSVEIPTLGIHTQGKNFKDSLAMARDALELLLGIAIEIEAVGKDKDEFTVTSKNLKPLVARYLETRREKAGWTLKQVAQKIGATSLNAYAQYEKGKAMPSVEKLRELTDAIPGPKAELLVTG